MSGSAGVVIPPVGYLQRLREICTANNILLIFDEVITGFGRMGAYTGAEAFGVTPDIMNVAKQVTNGAQPLGAVVAKQGDLRHLHGAGRPRLHARVRRTATPTRRTRWPARPASRRSTCWRRKTWSSACSALAPYFENAVHSLKGAKHVTDIRNYGLAAGFTIDAAARRAGQAPVRDRHGCWKRASTCATAATPSSSRRRSSATPAEIDSLVNALGETLNANRLIMQYLTQ